MARTSQPKPKTVKRKAWEALSRFIRARDKTCVTCKVRPAKHCGHFIRNSERNQQLVGNALWYDPRNFAGQCLVCNRYKSGEQHKFALYLEERYGHGILQELHLLWITPKKWTREEIEEKRRVFDDAFSQLAFNGLGVLHPEPVA